MNDNTLDLTPLIDELDDLRILIEELDGQALNIEAPSAKALMARKADVNKKLLLAAHEADSIRVGLMTAYHVFKGSIEPRSRT